MRLCEWCVHEKFQDSMIKGVVVIRYYWPPLVVPLKPYVKWISSGLVIGSSRFSFLRDPHVLLIILTSFIAELPKVQGQGHFLWWILGAVCITKERAISSDHVIGSTPFDRQKMLHGYKISLSHFVSLYDWPKKWSFGFRKECLESPENRHNRCRIASRDRNHVIFAPRQ